MPVLTYANLDYLHKVTAFLTACRARDPLGGMWDVGDLHWWWRDDLYSDPATQRFWEEDGEVFGFLLLSEDYAAFDYEFLPGLAESEGAKALFEEGLVWLEKLKKHGEEVAPSFYVRDDHHAFRGLARANGFKESGEAYIQAVQTLSGELSAVQLPAGFTVRPLEERDLTEGRPPVMRLSAPRFGRVVETPSYRRELHFVVVAHDGQVAAECICWWDRTNAIGVFEPVETAEVFRRRGLGKVLMREGLNRLSARGVRLAKVSYAKSNLAAARLYASVGFHRVFARDVYTRSDG